MFTTDFNAIDRPDIPVYIENVYTSEFELISHAHDKAQLIYAEGGIIHIFIEEEHWYLPGRFYMWIPAGFTHRIISHSKHIILYNYYFSMEEVHDDFYKKPNIYLVNDLLREMILFTKDWSGPITDSEPYKLLFMKAIQIILPQLGQSSATFMVKHPYPKDQRLVEIGSFLRQNMATAYTLDEIAIKFGFSTRTLSRLFKEDLGFSYVRFVRSLRMSNALELMAENKYSVLEIAEQVGYSSLSSFSNIFQKIIGIRPTEYMAKLTLYKEGTFKNPRHY
jgi:AraC-like DNA-binding protein